MERKQIKYILHDLKKKMVIIVGPRQVGKTWLAKEIGSHFKNTVYLNYDNRTDQQIIEKEAWLENTDLLILDEIHKMPNWQQFLKGVFDTRAHSMHILVTGSARMDIMSRSGESLAGRYFRHRLLPFSIAELKDKEIDTPIEKLLSRGGFPEPLLSESEIDAARWRNQYLDGLIRYDILDFQRMVDFKALQLTVDMLRNRVGSTISISSIARDINISPTTVSKYITLLEGLFLIFRVTPYSRNIARSLLKEPKIYFYDTGLVKGDNGAKIENLVAISLLKDIWARNDYLGESWQLNYVRTKEGKEVDFALVKDQQLSQLIECKTSDHDISKSLIYFSQKYSIPGIQLIAHLRNEYKKEFIEVRKTETYLRELFL